MPINITCPGCLSRFTVSDKFAGKKGPCPKCKKEIQVPEKSEEIVIHAPVDDSPKDSTGKAILKPIRREEKPLNKLAVIGGSVLAVVVLLVAVVVRFTTDSPPALLLVLGTIGIAPPLVLLAYNVLLDDELEGYDGNELWVRVGICSAVYAATWGIYVFLSYYFENKTVADTPIIQMGIYMIIMGVIGSLAALATLELEFGQSVLHYLFYFGCTLILCFIMRVELGEPLARPETPIRQAPAESQSPAATPAVPPAGGGMAQ
jgi:hypothetical protein